MGTYQYDLTRPFMLEGLAVMCNNSSGWALRAPVLWY
jgi:hypothetical protein